MFLGRLTILFCLLYQSFAFAADPLQVSFEPLKPTFKVGETIQFKIRGNKKFFLYLFSMNEKTDQSILILPNDLQDKLHNQYAADQTFTVPNPQLEFYSDSVGTERVIMMASTRYLNFEPPSTRAGNFWLSKAKAVLDWLKVVRLRASSSKENQLVVKELTLRIGLKPQMIANPEE